MLFLDNIVKNYSMGDMEVQALKGVSLKFRENEFVSILGQSGCGKTTLLNIIGGLDQYTSGDLVINGKSTKDFKDADWDTYRNHSIGFVFQSYNLIPHQTVLSNVELALTLSGVSKAERRKRAIEALEQVGLGDQLKKKPNQMSGGQMQRVAIARALVNNPDILLADEPTGALDTETSVQVMEILKEVAKDRLVIMVTHNPDLAAEYSNRIIRLLDGEIIGDSNPYNGEEIAHGETGGKKQKKPAMSFFTAVALSLNNLMTKKGRTFLTAFAGSIGIIGIALILSVSTGVNNYIDRVQEDTLSSYPITLEAERLDMTSLMTSLMGVSSESGEATHELDKIYVNSIMYDMMNTMYSADIETNNLSAFKAFLDTELEGSEPKTLLKENVSAIEYRYNLDFNIYTEDVDGTIIESDFMDLWSKMYSSATGSAMEGSDAGNMMTSMAQMSGGGIVIWDEMLPGENGELINPLIETQYNVIAGRWPESHDEVVLIVDGNNEVSDVVLYSLGLKSADEMYEIAMSVMKGETIDTSSFESWSYDEIIGKTFKLIYSADRYQKGTDGVYTDVSTTDLGLKTLYNNGEEIKLVGIIRPDEDAISGMMGGAIGYTAALTDHVIRETAEKPLVVEQLENPDVDVFNGLPFASDDAPEPSDAEKTEAIKEYLASVSNAKKAEIITAYMSVPAAEYVSSIVETNMQGITREYIETMVTQTYPEYESMLPSMDDETLFGYVRQMMEEQIIAEYGKQVEARLGSYTTDQLAGMFDMQPFTEAEYAALYDEYMPQTVSDSTYDKNIRTLGYVDLESPAAINIYAATFQAKDTIADIITDYNAGVSEADKINYTDYVALMMSSVSTIINAISYVLIAFVAISLVVSSIMIGIITYISVLERTKEIGILRAVGASKKDISRVFNAETFIIGLTSGALGIIVTLLLCIPANIIIKHFTDVGNLAQLPLVGGLILILISMILTVFSGLIPSGIAAKKDPVEALRSE